MPKRIVYLILSIVVMGMLLPVIFPMMTDTDTDIQAMNATGSEPTAFLQTAWPIVLLVIGLVVVLAIIMWAVNKLGII